MNRTKLRIYGAVLLAVLLLAGCGNATGKDTQMDTEQNTHPGTETPSEAGSEGTEISTKKMIALTFDDGPNTGTTVEILNVLEEYDVPATFFVNGMHINEESGPVLRRMVEQGCEIGNHGQNHLYMGKLTAEEIQAEVQQVQDLVEQYAGVRPQFFRPPYLDVSQTMFDNIDLVFVAGGDTKDYDNNTSAEARAENVLRQAQDGAVFILHCFSGNTKTADALYTIIPELQRQGYELVTVGDLFAAKGIPVDPEDVNMYYIVEFAE